MAAIAKRAMEAGAIGFGTSRTLNHRSSDGSPIATLTAGEDELTGIAMGMASANNGVGRGVLQVVSDFNDPAEEFAMLRRIVQASGRPLSFSLLQSPRDPEQWRFMLESMSEAKAAGLQIRRPGRDPAGGRAFRPGADRKPVQLAPQLSRDQSASPGRAGGAPSRPPASGRDYLPRRRRTRARRAFHRDAPGIASTRWARTTLTMSPRLTILSQRSQPSAGSDPYAMALDHMLDGGEGNGRGMLYLPLLNYAQNTLEPAYQMLQHDCVVPGLSDGGAHVGMICDGSFPTTNIVHWTRDRDAWSDAASRDDDQGAMPRHRRDGGSLRPRPDRAWLSRRPQRDRLLSAEAEGPQCRLRPSHGRASPDPAGRWLYRDHSGRPGSPIETASPPRPFPVDCSGARNPRPRRWLRNRCRSRRDARSMTEEG